MRKKTVLALASLLSILLTATVAAVTVWQTTQTISQTLQEAAQGSGTATITLPTGYKLIEGSYVEEGALTVTTTLPDMTLMISQDDAQKTTISSKYSKFQLSVIDSSTGETFLTFDMRTQSSAMAIIPDPGTYTFNYRFEYTPADVGEVTLTITVSVTK